MTLRAPSAHSLAPAVAAALEYPATVDRIAQRIRWIPGLGRVSRVRVRHALQLLRARGEVQRVIRESDYSVWWERR